MPRTAARRGAQMEMLAALWLRMHGLRILSRNYRWRGGELDIIARNRTCVVFVEVRFRRHARYMTGAESIDMQKLERIVRTAKHYLVRHPELTHTRIRFDVISICQPNYLPTLQWIRNAYCHDVID